MSRDWRGWMIAGMAVVLLAGCAHWQAGPDAPFVRWKCSQPDHIAWRRVDREGRRIDLQIGDEPRAYRLVKEPSLRGRFYSNGVIAFHDKDGEALVYRLADDALLAYGCRASLINL